MCGRLGRRARASAATLVNPATEEALATASTEGLDFGAALAFARDRGGPALRALTFAQRGELLRAMSQGHPRQARRAPRARHRQRRQHALRRQVRRRRRHRARSRPTPTSRSELGDATLLVDGDGVAARAQPAPLRAARRTSPREGVAVHVNAFNFPAWGLGEKAACALLAGMPVIAKPATSTALVAHRIVQILVDEKVLPEGALSFVCGSSGDLLDRLGGQDVLAFTGFERDRRRCSAAGKAFTHASAHVQRRGRQPQRRGARARRRRRLGAR